MPRALRFAIVILFFAHPALAQSRVFVGANLFADTKTFSGDASTNSLNGTALGGSVDGGVTLNDHFSLRITVGMGGKTTTSTPIPIGVLAPVLARVTVPITSFRSDVTNRLVSTSVLIGYQFPVHDRVHISALGGLSFLHVTRDYNTVGPLPLASVNSTITSALVVRPHTLIDQVPGVTVGAEVAVDLTHHLAIVPDVHVSAFSLSNGGPSGFAIRPGIGARWTF